MRAGTGRRIPNNSDVPDLKHASAFYSATADANLTFPPLAGDTRADVAIIGGGYTGLSAALHLAERGIDVALVEAKRVGWGASGRNGGQLHSGQRMDQDYLERLAGAEAALDLWKMAEEAKALFHELRQRHAIDCEWRAGLIEAVHKRRLVDHERRYVEKLRTVYGYEHASWLDRAALAERLGTDVYEGGRLDATAGHLHPLKWAQGLARAASNRGARIHEGTPAVKLKEGAARGVVTKSGTITADITILAGNGLLEGIDEETEARVLPIVNYILVTEPIGAGQPGAAVLPNGEAVSDTRFVVYYFRPSPDGRLLFGGGETYSRPIEEDISNRVRKHLRRVYPRLADVRIDDTWCGTVAITRKRLPFIRRLRPGVYVASGYSGQGVALAPYAGKVLADAIGGDTARLDRFAQLPCPRFPGGKLLRFPTLLAGMAWYRLRDRL
jgi:gamma-glutamylputrescine oxidase